MAFANQQAGAYFGDTSRVTFSSGYSISHETRTLPSILIISVNCFPKVEIHSGLNKSYILDFILSKCLQTVGTNVLPFDKMNQDSTIEESIKLDNNQILIMLHFHGKLVSINQSSIQETKTKDPPWAHIWESKHWLNYPRLKPEEIKLSQISQAWPDINLVIFNNGICWFKTCSVWS